MSLIKTQGLDVDVDGRRCFREMILKGDTPYILSILFIDGSVTRKVFRTETEVMKFLSEEKIEVEVFSMSGSKKLSVKKGYLQEYQVREGNYVDLIVEQLIPMTSVVIFGAGHVGRAVAQVAAQMGWDIIVIDDRVDFLEQIDDSSGKVKKIDQHFEYALRDINLNSTCAAVIVTRGHQFDQLCLEASLKTDAFYIGMIGSKRRVASVFRELLKKGVSDRKLSEVHAPIGLDIGAKTPQEIAVSIVGEIIKFKNLPIDSDSKSR